MLWFHVVDAAGMTTITHGKGAARGLSRQWRVTTSALASTMMIEPSRHHISSDLSGRDARMGG
jgi:hypothetical protein